MRGNFDDAGEFGEFFGEDVIDGVTYRLRFRWWNLGDGKAKWDQAYKLPDSDDVPEDEQCAENWEVNWVMEFEREE